MLSEGHNLVSSVGFSLSNQSNRVWVVMVKPDSDPPLQMKRARHKSLKRTFAKFCTITENDPTK